VKFGSKACTTYVSWSATQIKCKVPATAKYGAVQVTVATAAGKSNAMSFTVKSTSGGNPNTPTGRTPTGTVTTYTPTFSWSAVKGARTYELRVIEHGRWVLKMTRIKGLSYTSQAPLPANSNLTWQVRAITARGAGSWSKRLAFRVTI